MLLSPAKTGALLPCEAHRTMPFATCEGELQSHLQTQTLPGVSGRAARGEVPEGKAPKDKEGTAWPKQRLQAMAAPAHGVSETKGNLSSAIHVDRVGIAGWTEKSLSPVKAR